MKNLLRIAWITIRELIYERVFYIFLTFAVLSLGLSMLLGQLTYAEQAKLTLDFMLAGIEISMVLFSIFMGIGLFKKEFVVGSVAMVLSKPISRSTFLLGKYLGQIFVQFVVIIAMVMMTISLHSNFGEVTSYLAIFQTGLMIFLEVSVLTAIAYFFAVISGTITAVVVTLSMFCIGHLKGSFLLTLNQQEESLIWKMSTAVIPDMDIFNMKTIASYGYSVGWAHMGWAMLYALCCSIFFLLISSICFNHKDVIT